MGVVILLSGRYAGKKAVIVKPYDSGDNQRKYGHCLVAGIERAPRTVTKRMPQKKIQRRSTIKPFLKVVNYNHIMPTRYQLPLGVSDAVVNKAALKDAASRTKARKEIKKAMQESYKKGENKWFFSK